MNQQSEFSIGPVVGYTFKAKYKVIHSVLEGKFDGYSGIDVFLDLNTLIMSLSTNQKFMNSLPFSKNVQIDIISSILYMVKHWKDFLSRYSGARIILMYNDFEMAALSESDTIKSYLFPYVNHFKQDRFNQFTYYWNEAMNTIGTILKYIPSVYLIKCNRFDSYVVPNLFDSYEKRFRLIVTGNPLMTNYTYMPNTQVMFSRYRRSGNFQISDPLMIIQSMSTIHDDVMEVFARNKVFYNLLSIIIGDKYRGLIGLTQIAMTLFATNLIRSIEKREIPQDPKSIESVLKSIDPMYHDPIRKAYPLVDIESHTALVAPSLVEKTKASLIDIYDIDSLRSLSIDGLNLLELL
jgi:hypothetical protein